MFNSFLLSGSWKHLLFVTVLHISVFLLFPTSLCNDPLLQASKTKHTKYNHVQWSEFSKYMVHVLFYYRSIMNVYTHTLSFCMITKLITYLNLFLHIFILCIEGYGLIHVGVRGQIAGLDFLLLLYGFQRQNLGLQAWEKEPLICWVISLTPVIYILCFRYYIARFLILIINYCILGTLLKMIYI